MDRETSVSKRYLLTLQAFPNVTERYRTYRALHTEFIKIYLNKYLIESDIYEDGRDGDGDGDGRDGDGRDGDGDGRDGDGDGDGRDGDSIRIGTFTVYI
jgi:hypothetical protein